MMFLSSLLLLFLINISCNEASPYSGAVSLARNGSYSYQYSSGRVVVYGFGNPSNTSLNTSLYWGNICRYSSFGKNEADVICHQLTYSGASSWSYAGIDMFGIDTRHTRLNDVSCDSNDYLMLFQCHVNPVITQQCNDDSNDVSVTCYTTRIWNNPFNGAVRLTGGSFTNEGLLEVYCNGQWGTVCDNSFGPHDATAACRQLGYSSYYTYNTLFVVGTTAQPIWLNELHCSNGDRCIADCQRCPGEATTRCVHADDVTLICYSPKASGSSNTYYSLCKYNNNAVILGATFGTLGGIIVIIIIIALILHDKKKKGQLHNPCPQHTRRIAACFASIAAFFRRCRTYCSECSSYTCVCPCQKRTTHSLAHQTNQPLTVQSVVTTPPVPPTQPHAPPTQLYAPSNSDSQIPPPDTANVLTDKGLRREEPPLYDPTWAYPPPN